MVELQLRVAGVWVEALSDALMDELGALSASVEDAHADTDAEQALFGEPGMPEPPQGWDDSVIKALFETPALAEAAAELIQAHDWEGGVHIADIQPVPDQDWVRLTQSQFAPVAITSDFWIVPSWHEPPVGASKVIRLDPGLAFGTGTHPTTRMCLRWLAQASQPQAPWAQVLDYGCGSGILAIGAALFGAQQVTGVDIDPAAVHATLANAAANQVVVQAGQPERVEGLYDVVVANILATPLKLLAPLLSGLVRPGGHLILAGILARQAEELQAAYADGVPLVVADEEDGWILMTGRRQQAV
ncbi:MAG: 50S ribosomal protein L11 methyltransferase [Pseudomonadota bacterium]